MNIQYQALNENDEDILVTDETGTIKERKFYDNVIDVMALENNLENDQNELKALQEQINLLNEQMTKKYKHGWHSIANKMLAFYGSLEIMALIISFNADKVFGWFANEPVTSSLTTAETLAYVLASSALVFLLSFKELSDEIPRYKELKFNCLLFQKRSEELEERISKTKKQIEVLEKNKNKTKKAPLESTRVYNNNHYSIKELKALKAYLKHFKKYMKYFENGKLEEKLSKKYDEEEVVLIKKQVLKNYYN